MIRDYILQYIGNAKAITKVLHLTYNNIFK